MRRNLAPVLLVFGSLSFLAGCDNGTVIHLFTPTATPSNTPVPTHTPTVPVPPSSTPTTAVPSTSTPTSTQAPSNTPVTPSATPTTPAATATETSTPPPTFTATVTPTGVQIIVGRAVAGTAGTASVNVSLVGGGASVGGVQTDLLFDNSVIDLGLASSCRINPAIAEGAAGCESDPPTAPCKTLSRSLVVCGGQPNPPGCPADAGANISRFRAIIAATAVPNNNLIPDGVLYTCEFSLSNLSALPQVISITNVVASAPGGDRLDDVSGAAGVITLGARVAVAAPAGTTDILIEADDAATFAGSGMADINGQIVGFTRSGNVLILDEPLALNAAVGDLVLIATPAPSPTPTPSFTKTKTPTATATVPPPTATPASTNTPVPTATETPIPEDTATPTETATEEATATPTDTATATATEEATATDTVAEATATETAPADTPTPTP